MVEARQARPKESDWSKGSHSWATPKDLSRLDIPILPNVASQTKA